MDLIKSLNWRYATKVFDPEKKVSDVDLNTLLEALRLTPSSFGLQFWKFLVVTNPQIREKLVEQSWNQRQVADSSHLIVFCRPAQVTHADVDRYIQNIADTRQTTLESLEGYSKMMKGFLDALKPEQKQAWMEKQIYIALGVLHTACALLQIDSCPMEGFVSGAYDEILGLPAKGLKSVVVCPIGYRSANDKAANLKKVRYPIKDCVDWI